MVMLKDIKRHLNRTSTRVALILIVVFTFYTFFKDGVFSVFKFVFCLGIAILIFLMFLWGRDNPEENK